MQKKRIRTKQSEYGYCDNYKRTRLKWTLMGQVADHYKAEKAAVGEDRDTIMVYFKNGARLFMAKRSGCIQFYFIGTGVFDSFPITKFLSVEEIVLHMDEYMINHEGTAVFDAVLTERDRQEV